MKRYISGRLKLVVNETKSQVVELPEACVAVAALRPAGSLRLAVSLRSALGFQVIRGRVRWSEKSRERFKQSVKTITRRTRGISPVKMIEELACFVRGALNYYAIGIPFGEARELDQWMRRRVRLYYWTAWPRSGVRMVKDTAERRA